MPIILGQLLLVAVIGYLWGSVPAGYWMGKLLRGKNFDIRDYGSHKTGATNVLRTLGKGPALIVFAFDLSKGVGPVLLAMLVPFLYVSAWGPSLAALAALVGHCYPIFIGFKGGRGVSTTAGALLVISQNRLVGILSERDIVRVLAEQGASALMQPLAQVMTRKVFTCSPSETIGVIMERMTAGKFRHVPVIEQDQVVGVVSIGDVVKYRLQEMEHESAALRDYIQSA